jgi:hypothetical protein
MAVPAQAGLSGMGFDFAATVSGSSSQTVSSGQTASFTLVLKTLSGSSGIFAFSCGSLPANAACSFNPAGETVAASAPGNVAVQVATGGAASARNAGISGWGIGTMLAGVVLLPLAWRRNGKFLVMAALLAILVGGLTSCSGSGGGTDGTQSGGQGNSTTPAGTYSIPVAVTSSGVVHTVTLTLIVD